MKTDIIELTLNDVIPFGKFKGMPLDWLITGKSKVNQFLPDLSDNECIMEFTYLKWFDKNVKNSCFF